MTDPSALIVGGLVAYASKDLISKVLGPTADYLGNETKDLVQASAKNLSAILRSAYSKISFYDVTESNGVHLRVLREVVSEGRFIDDEVAQSYFGGILCSAKRDGSEDDRGVFYLSLIKQLSKHQISLHYIIYLALARSLQSKEPDFFDKIANRRATKIYIPHSLVFQIMQIDSKADFYTKAEQALSGLSYCSLIGAESGLVDGVAHEEFRQIEGTGLVVSPTLLGSDCFLWGNGISNMPGSRLGHAHLIEEFNLIDVSDVVVVTP